MKNIKKKLDEVLFIDIETVGQKALFKDLPDSTKSFWTHKAKLILRDKSLDINQISKAYFDKAGIYSEFGKVVCISIGYLVTKSKKIVGIRTKSLYGDNEKKILSDFSKIMDSHFDKPKEQFLCGHNIKEFDIPYLCRRMLIHGLKIPKPLDISGKKPWEVTHLLDTMQMWRFGDYKNYTSLALMAHVFEIPTPKDDIDGSMVHEVYWNQKDLKRIVKYCEKDVITVAKVLMRLLRVDISDDLKTVSKTKW